MKNIISDMIVSGILKKGILAEVKPTEIEFDIPMEAANTLDEIKSIKSITVKIKCEGITIRFDDKNE